VRPPAFAGGTLGDVYQDIALAMPPPHFAVKLAPV
jgi:hypothetical protein